MASRNPHSLPPDELPPGLPMAMHAPSPVDLSLPPPDVELIETDGEPLETDWHRIEINLLIELVYNYLAARTDFYAGGNMFIYYNAENARNKDYRGPDFFFVEGSSSTPLRPYWAVWKEGGRFPDVIIELLSPTTAHIDRTTKKDIYERVFRTSDYYCYDPETKQLEGWALKDGRYAPLIPNERGWLWSAKLGLWVGVWEGRHYWHDTTWLRLFTPDGKLVPTTAEAGQKSTDVERQRADALQAEVAQLRAQLAAQPKPQQP